MSAETNSKPRTDPLTLAEIEKIASEIREAYTGAQLQDCLQTKAELGLAFYHAGETHWLWLDLDPHRPVLVRVFGQPPRRKKIARPLTLFLKSRFLGRRLKGVRADSERGRILIFEFHRARDEEEQGPCLIECRLFPHGQNVIAFDGAKSIAELKPKEVSPSQSPPPSQPREWREIEEAWWQQQSLKPDAKGASSSVEALARDYRKALEKKELALQRMREELEAKMSSEPAEVGEWLKAHGTLDVPEKWQAWIDKAQTLAWNIERCFHRAKENMRKAEGTRERLRQVESELEALRSEGIEGFQKARTSAHGENQKKKANLLAHAQARGRRFQLADDLDVYVGKSAADNLALLRRAQPFDYWLHLRDQPGSHAILRRARGRMVTDEEFRRAGIWVVEQSLGKRAHELKGERFDLLLVECRFVRPIKGDKLGRVNYTNDRVLNIRFS